MELTDFQNNFSQTLRGFLGVVEIDEPIFSRTSFSQRGQFNTRLRFYTGDILVVRANVETSASFPQFRSYTFQFMSADEEIYWRYDRNFHHPEIATSPHHKHTWINGEEHIQDSTIVENGEPRLGRIFQEIDELLRTG